MKTMASLDEYINTKGIIGAGLISAVKDLFNTKGYMMAVRDLSALLKKKSQEGPKKHDINYYAFQIAKSSANIEVKSLVKAYLASGMDTYGF